MEGYLINILNFYRNNNKVATKVTINKLSLMIALKSVEGFHNKKKTCGKKFDFPRRIYTPRQFIF